jgi:hypothetical protein
MKPLRAPVRRFLRCRELPFGVQRVSHDPFVLERSDHIRAMRAVIRRIWLIPAAGLEVRMLGERASEIGVRGVIHSIVTECASASIAARRFRIEEF